MLTYDGSSEREATTDTHKLGRLRSESQGEKWPICGDFLRNACLPVGIPWELVPTDRALDSYHQLELLQSRDHGEVCTLLELGSLCKKGYQ